MQNASLYSAVKEILEEIDMFYLKYESFFKEYSSSVVILLPYLPTPYNVDTPIRVECTFQKKTSPVMLFQRRSRYGQDARLMN